MRRWIRRGQDDPRAQLADDARRVAGYADAVVDRARRLGDEVPEDVGACTEAWRHWAGQLARWAHPGPDDQ
jgi:hypothetical protein